MAASVPSIRTSATSHSQRRLRHRSKPLRSALHAVAAATAFASASTRMAHGANTYTWSGPANGDFSVRANFTGANSTLPSPVNGDVIVFNNAVAGNLALSWSNTSYSGNTSSPGITLSLTGAQTSNVSVDAPGSSLRLGAITIAASAGSFTLGGSTGSFGISVGTPAIDIFTNNSTNTATVGADTVWSNTSAATKTYQFGGTGNWTFNSNITPTNATATGYQLITSGTVTYNGTAPATSTGSVAIGSGGNSTVVRLNGSGEFGSGSINFDSTGNGSTARLEINNTGSAFTWTNPIALFARNNSTVAIENVAGNDTFNSATITFGAGGGTYTLQSDAGTLAFSNAAANWAIGARVLALQGAGNGSIASSVTGAGSIVKGTGTGAWTLTGTNTYTGVTNITAGGLVIAGSGGVNSSSAISVNGSGAKFVSTSSVAVTPVVNLAQGTVDGTGTINTVSATASTAIANGNGGSATLNIGSLGFAGAGTVNFNIPAGANTGSVGLNVTTLSTAGSPITLNVTPFLSWVNGSTYDLAKYATFTGTGSTADFVGGTVSGLSSRQTPLFGVDTTNNFLTLTINGDSPKWTGLDGNAWQIGSTGANSNWKLITAATATNYIDGDQVLFDDSAAGTTTINVTGTLSPNGITFNNGTLNYTLGGSVTLLGSTSLVKNGAAALTINNNNFYTGATNFNAGTVTLNGTLGSSGGTTVSTAATFLENPTGVIAGTSSFAVTGGTSTLLGSNSYTGATSISGSATLQLGDGTNGHDGSIGSTSTLTIATGGALIFNRSGAATAGYPITGGGSVTMTGTGTQTLAGANSYTGGTAINGGVLAASADNNLGAPSSGVTLNGGTYKDTVGLTNTHAFTFGASGGTINVAAVVGQQLYFHTANTILGSGTLTLTGPGVLTANQGNLRIDQSNSFSGPVAISGGGIFEYGVANAVASAATFNIANQAELSVNSGVSMPNAITVSGGTNSVLSFENGTTGDFTGPIALNANAIVGLRDWYNNATLRGGIIDGTITGTGGITVNSGTANGGTLTLTGSNTYSGGTTIVASRVFTNNNNALGTGSVSIGGTNSQIDLASGVNVGNALTITSAGGVGAGVFTQGVLWIPTAGATATYSGAITINAVTASGGDFAANAGQLNLTGPITSSVPVTVRQGTIAVSNTSSNYSTLNIQAGTVQDLATNAIPSTATVSLGVSGNATLDLMGNNQTLAGLTQTGSTTAITNGMANTTSTLIMNGSSTYAGSINNGAGTVALTVNNGGQFALTNSSNYSGATAVTGGTLTLNGTLTAAGSISVNSAGSLILNSANNVPSSVAITGTDAASNFIVNQSQTIGSMGFAGTTTVASGATLTVNPIGPSTAGPIAGAGTLAVTGANSLTARSIRTSALTVAAGSTAAIAYDTQAHTHGTPIGTSVVTTLSIDPSTGTLDLTNNGIVILDTTQLSTVRSLITQAADVSVGVAHWDMPGITSSTAAADHSHAVGYALASTLPGGGSTSFNGITFSDAVIARYTLVGDTGLKGTVDLSDYTKVVLNLGKSNAGWSDGNFDYSGNVNLGDYTAVIRNLGRSDGQSSAFNATGPAAQQVKTSSLTLHTAPAVTQASTATDVTLLVNPTNGRVTLVNALQTGQAVITAFTINSPSQSLLPFSADGGGKYLANALENNPSVFYKASNGLTYNLWTGIKNVSTFIGEGFSNHYNANVDSTWTNYTLATSGYALGTLFKRLSSGGTRDLVFQWEDANLNTYTSVVTYVGAVPEPGSVSLVAMGAMAMLGRRRRAQSKR